MRKCKRTRRRGSIVVLTAICLVVIIAFLAFSVDIGRITVTHTELQNAADAAALSGARGLSTSPAQARVKASELAAANFAANESVSLTAAQDVEIGTWDEDTATFTVLTGSDEDDGDAVRVTCLRTAARGNALDMSFGRLLGTSSADVTAFAIATIVVPKCGRFVGIDDADVNSGYVDSYDSSVGTYDSQTPGDEGHVCSNGDITLRNSTINGDALPGEDYDVTTHGAGTVTGSTDPHPPKTYPPVDMGNAPTINDNGEIPSQYWTAQGKLSIPSSASVTFGGGTLYVDDSLRVNGELIITGPTEIYVSENVDIAGSGIVNQSQSPGDLKIFVAGSTASAHATVAGSANFYGVIYGPTVKAKTAGNAEFYGSMIGKTLTLTSNGGTHFDESLDPVGGSAVTIKLVQ